MVRFDHVSLPVRDFAVSRRWYADSLGLTVEFEVAARKTVALQDDGGLTS